MKPELNNETKLRFYAQYYGHYPFCYGYEDWEKRNMIIVDGISLRMSEEESSDPSYYDYLELKPLSTISDEEAITVANTVLGLNSGHSYITEKGCTDTVIHIKISNVRYMPSEREYGCSTDYLPQKISDFLRSKGYALPFQGISVDEQVQAGWVRLRE